MWTELTWLISGETAASYEHGNELSESVQDRRFLDQISYYQLLKKDFIQCISLTSRDM
jgi:hypothetical protein